jgi:hypothetical protein
MADVGIGILGAGSPSRRFCTLPGSFLFGLRPALKLRVSNFIHPALESNLSNTPAISSRQPHVAQIDCGAPGFLARPLQRDASAFLSASFITLH